VITRFLCSLCGSHASKTSTRFYSLCSHGYDLFNSNVLAAYSFFMSLVALLTLHWSSLLNQLHHLLSCRLIKQYTYRARKLRRKISPLIEAACSLTGRLTLHVVCSLLSIACCLLSAACCLLLAVLCLLQRVLVCLYEVPYSTNARPSRYRWQPLQEGITPPAGSLPY
jgi:small-conductance mechanosensitive channel